MYIFDNVLPLTFQERLKIENEILEQSQINKSTRPLTINILRIINRQLDFIYEKYYNIPQNIFYIKYYLGYIIVGRKLRSILHQENKINAINCSLITASMLLGVLKNFTRIQDGFLIEFSPFTNGEKLTIFKQIKTNRKIDISFPFKYYDFYTKKEKVCSKDGWTLNKERIINLGFGEEHIREYTISLLDKLITHKNTVIFDPACSTGQFLFTLKTMFPDCKTIGQDLSLQMVEYAKDFVDEIYIGDAIDSPVTTESVDIMFLRFLNSEIVTSRYAKQLFIKLLEKVKISGIVIAFGHTPLLLQQSFFKKFKINILQNNAYDTRTDSLFQYYVLQKLE